MSAENMRPEWRWIYAKVGPRGTAAVMIAATPFVVLVSAIVGAWLGAREGVEQIAEGVREIRS